MARKDDIERTRSEHPKPLHSHGAETGCCFGFGGKRAHSKGQTIQMTAPPKARQKGTKIPARGR